jgi:branched-chain amino acid transport system permease protein
MLFLQVVIFGLLLGGVYALLSSGLTLIFGVLDVVNVAQGAFLISGAFFTWQVWKLSGIEPLLLLPVVTIIWFGLGILIFKGLFARVAAQGPSMTVLLSFGIALVFEGALNLIFGNKFKSIQTPYSLDSWTIGSIVFPITQIIACSVAAITLFLMYIYLKYSWAGRALRATAQNRDGAALIGISHNRASSIAYGLGMATAGAGGVLVSVTYPFFPASHYDWITKLLGIIVLGGMGSLPGAIIGSIVLGITEAAGNTYAPQWTILFFYGVIMLVLLFKPEGILGARTRIDSA